MLFGGKIPFHVAARLTPRFWVPHLLRFATFRHYSRLRTTGYSYYSLFVIRTIRDYSLFVIRVFQTPQSSRLPLVDTWSISVKSVSCKTQWYNDHAFERFYCIESTGYKQYLGFLWIRDSLDKNLEYCHPETVEGHYFVETKQFSVTTQTPSRTLS